MDRAAVSRLGFDDRTQRKANVVLCRGETHIRRRAPLLAMSCRKQGERIRAKARGPNSIGEDRHRLRIASDSIVAVFGIVSIRNDFRSSFYD
jgi:hypothetical protein